MRRSKQDAGPPIPGAVAYGQTRIGAEPGFSIWLWYRGGAQSAREVTIASRCRTRIDVAGGQLQPLDSFAQPCSVDHALADQNRDEDEIAGTAGDELRRGEIV